MLANLPIRTFLNQKQFCYKIVFFLKIKDDRIKKIEALLMEMSIGEKAQLMKWGIYPLQCWSS